MDIITFLKILAIVSILKGIFEFGVYWFLAHHIPKIWAGLGVFFFFSLVPWLLVMYAPTEMIEQLGRLTIWGAETIISVIFGGVCIFFYELLAGKRETGRY